MIPLWIAATLAITSPEPPGLLYLVVFDEAGQTREHVPVEVLHPGGQTLGQTLGQTDTRGALRLALPPGDVRLKIGPHEAGPIAIVSGHVSEVIATSGDTLTLLVEVPRKIAAVVASEGPTGTLSGAVVDARARPVPMARVFVRGLPGELVTDRGGTFTAVVPAGKVGLTVVHPAHSPRTLEGVEVPPGGLVHLELALEPAAAELDSFVVSAPRIVGSTLEVLAERRDTTAVGEILGAEQMSRAGDSSAATALRRVTGVTVIDGRFVYVRGLGERYASALLDGAQLPSPEPERRVVPLDLFPTGLLEGIAIQKSWTPDMPGEFGGGVVQIRTRGFPTEPTARVQLSTAVRLSTTFERGLMGQGGPTDIFGFDGGHRDLPDEVRAASERAPLLERDMFSERGYTDAELERFGELMATDWSPSRGLVPPDLGLTLSGGTSLELGPESRLGVFGSLGYGSAWSLGDELERYFTVGQNGTLELSHVYHFDELDHRVTLSALLVTGLDDPHHTVRLTSLMNRISSDDARIYEGNNRDVGAPIRVTRLQWVEQMLLTNQLRGTHHLGDPSDPTLTLAWHYALSLATRLEPDRRQTRYDLEDADQVWRLSDRPEGNRRVFSTLSDLAHDLALSAKLRLDLGDLVTHLTLGLSGLFKDRRVDTRRYRFQHQGPLSRDTTILSLPAEEIFSDQHLGTDGFMLTETTLETDNYTADQVILATFLRWDLELFDGLDLVLGARLEHSSQEVGTFVPFSPNAERIGADLTTLDLLPALALAWEPVEDHIVRLGYAMTVSRPDFRELSPATYNDVTGGRQYFGNPELARATIQHLDLRWEWFPSARDLLSVGGFYKHFEDPIEVVVVPSAQLSVTFDNASSADNVGLELEARKSLEFIADTLRDLYVAGNLALIHSRISLDGQNTIQTNRERPLQGQSPWVVNLQLGWEQAELGTHLTLLWNVFGPRIVEVGALGAPDTYEEPVHQLDLVWQQSLGDGWDLSFKAQNLLDPPTRLTQGRETLSRQRRGRNLSLAIGYTF